MARRRYYRHHPRYRYHHRRAHVKVPLLGTLGTLAGVSLSAYGGYQQAGVGPNGQGANTALNAINGIISGYTGINYDNGNMKFGVGYLKWGWGPTIAGWLGSWVAKKIGLDRMVFRKLPVEL